MVCLGLDEAFNGIGHGMVRPCVESTVDYAIPANTEDFDKFEGIVIDKGTQRRWSGGIGF